MSRGSAVVVLVVASLACRRERPRIDPDPVDASVVSVADAAPASIEGFHDASPACVACLAGLVDAGASCASLWKACVDDPACVDHVACVEKCRVAGSPCMEACSDGCALPALLNGEAYLFCACCRSPCSIACEDRCAVYRSTLTGPVGAGCLMPGFERAPGACQACLEATHSTGGVSSPEWAACDEGCDDYATCVARCAPGASRAACVAACDSPAKGPATGTAKSSKAKAESYLRKSCCACGKACSATCAVHGAAPSALGAPCGT